MSNSEHICSLTFLGTSSGMPTIYRNVSACLIKLYSQKKMWLFDCGEGTFQQILKSKENIQNIDKIFISHLHGDHCFGLPALICSMALGYNKNIPVIYGPSGIKKFIMDNLNSTYSLTNKLIEIVEITPNDDILFENDLLQVSSIFLKHRVPTIAIKILLKKFNRNIYTDKLKQLKIKPASWIKDLKQGLDVVIDNHLIKADTLLTPAITPKKIIICGDTEPSENLIKFSQNADILVHEATYPSELIVKAREWQHSTVKEVLEIAKATNIKNLILTHFSARYNENILYKEKQLAKELFLNTYFAEDFKTFSLNKQSEIIN